MFRFCILLFCVRIFYGTFECVGAMGHERDRPATAAGGAAALLAAYRLPRLLFVLVGNLAFRVLSKYTFSVCVFCQDTQALLFQ